LILRRTNQILTIIMLATAVVGLRFLVVGCASAVEAPLTIVVDISRGRLVCLSKQARKVIVSDPAVLQVTISTDGMILTGLDLGETTMVVLDERGADVMESTVRVESASEPDIFVQRGLERRAYHCALQTCQRNERRGRRWHRRKCQDEQ
jgi:Flp pilus assembly secretin CpaC